MGVAIDILPGDGEFSFEPSESVTIESLGYVQHQAVGSQRKELLGEQYAWGLQQIRLKGTDGTVLPPALTDHGVKPQAALFNVVVALEWTPSAAFLDELRHAFTTASQLLYDVTDGYMAIGQVVVGGPDLMPVADIQMFASNRLLPRSSVFGLLNPAEYRPIRLGRGLWDKKEHRAIPWNKGYGALVHEWGHYALGLKDQYLRQEHGGTNGATLVVPGLSLTVDSIMARGTSSELLDNGKEHILCLHDAPISEWAQLAARPEFHVLGIDQGHVVEEAAPALTPQPVFYGPNDWEASDLLLSTTARFPQDLDIGHCWLYLLREGTAGRQLIPQGTVERGASGGSVRLVGARVGDQIVLLGNSYSGEPLVYRGMLAEASGDQARVNHWQDVTPDTWPLVAVVPGQLPAPPASAASYPTDRLTVSVLGAPGARVEIFPLGGAGSVRPEADGSYLVPSLDGAVVLRWGTGPDERLAICHYSQGGSPDGGYPAHPNPLPSGSGEGNAMLFFYDKTMAEPGSGESPAKQANGNDSRRIVTTTNYNVPAPGGLQARSYVFGVASNFWLDKVRPLDPTLILYFDGAAEAQLGLFRHDGAGWQKLGSTVFADRFLVAASLDAQAAGNLYAADAPGGVPRTGIEFYRLLVPVNS